MGGKQKKEGRKKEIQNKTYFTGKKESLLCTFGGFMCILAHFILNGGGSHAIIKCTCSTSYQRKRDQVLWNIIMPPLSSESK